MGKKAIYRVTSKRLRSIKFFEKLAKYSVWDKRRIEIHVFWIVVTLFKNVPRSYTATATRYSFCRCWHDKETIVIF